MRAILSYGHPRDLSRPDKGSFTVVIKKLKNY